MKLEFLSGFSKKAQISGLIKIRPVGAELFHVDSQTDMTKLIVAFRNFENALKRNSVRGVGLQTTDGRVLTISCSQLKLRCP